MTEGAPADAVIQKAERVEIVKLVAVTVVWFLMTLYLAPLGDRFVPDAWKAKISLQTFRMVCQFVTLSVGVALSFVALNRPRQRIGLVAPKPAHLAASALLAPAAFVASTYIALQIALPTLLAELATHGPGASQRNAGEFGRTVTQAPLLVVLLWGALLGAVGEEMLFRGALWSALRDVTKLVMGGARPAEAQVNVDVPGSPSDALSTDAPISEPPPFVQKSPLAALSRDMIPGSVATIGTAILFGQMHADMPGGVGVVRVASTTILGLVCGLGRQTTGTIAVPILLHIVNNTLTIGTSRKWFAAPGEPILEGLPNRLVLAAAIGILAAAIAVVAVVVLRRRRASA